MQLSVSLMVKKAFFSLYIVSLLCLAGCTSTTEIDAPVCEEGSTPVHPVFAKRAYNKPYEIMGQTYYPRNCYNYSEVGEASYYGGRDVFHGRKTSMGHTFDKDYLTAAHKELPIPCIVNVTNLENGRAVKVKINDRGPFIPGRIIDVSEKAARLLGFYQQGIARVRVEVCVNDTLELIKAMPTAAQAKLLNGNQAKKLSVTSKQKNKKKDKPKSGDDALIVSKHLKEIESERLLEQTIASKPLSQKIFVDVGTFNSLSMAEKWASKMAHRYKIQQSKSRKNKKYRLLAGPVTSKKEANLLLKKAIKLGAKSAKVVS